jgi:hypothetical protein
MMIVFFGLSPERIILVFQDGNNDFFPVYSFFNEDRYRLLREIANGIDGFLNRPEISASILGYRE